MALASGKPIPGGTAPAPLTRTFNAQAVPTNATTQAQGAPGVAPPGMQWDPNAVNAQGGQGDWVSSAPNTASIPGQESTLNTIGDQLGDRISAGPVGQVYRYAKGVIDPSTPANPANSTDAQNARDFGTALRNQYQNFQGAQAPILDEAQIDRDRLAQQTNIGREVGIANGTTRTAADALLQQGTDQAAKNAAGLAAEYSSQNPGAALRQGLAASNNAYATAAAPAAQLKAQEQQAAIGNIGQATAGMTAGSTAQAEANQQAKVATQGQNNQLQLGQGTLAANETNAPLQAQIANQNAAVQTNAQKQQGFGSLAGGVGALVTALSDKRSKKNIAPTSFANAMADKIHGVTFEYTAPGSLGEALGKKAGVLAQDVEKVFPGVVVKREDGLKAVDTRHATLATMGVVSELARRLRDIEGKRDQKDHDE